NNAKNDLSARSMVQQLRTQHCAGALTLDDISVVAFKSKSRFVFRLAVELAFSQPKLVDNIELWGRMRIEASESDDRWVRLKIASGLQKLELSDRTDIALRLAKRKEDRHDEVMAALLWYAI